MSSVFISYSRVDYVFADKLALELEKRNGRESVWIDRQSIRLSSDRWEEIKHGIEATDSFVLIMSPDSMSSPLCHLEIEYARQLGKQFVLVNHRPFSWNDAAIKSLTLVEEDAYIKQLLANHDPTSFLDANWLTINKYHWIAYPFDPTKSEKYRSGELETEDERKAREAEEIHFYEVFPTFQEAPRTDVQPQTETSRQAEHERQQLHQLETSHRQVDRSTHNARWVLVEEKQETGILNWGEENNGSRAKKVHGRVQARSSTADGKQR